MLIFFAGIEHKYIVRNKLGHRYETFDTYDANYFPFSINFKASFLDLEHKQYHYSDNLENITNNYVEIYHVFMLNTC